MNREAALQSQCVFAVYLHSRDHRPGGIPWTARDVRTDSRQWSDSGIRLIRSNRSYLWRTGSDLIRILVIYRPFRSFMLLAIALFTIATIIALRFLYYFTATDQVPATYRVLF